MPDARGAAASGARGARPSTRASASRPIPPGRSSTGSSSVNATIVDSMPTGQAPPSRIRPTASPRSSATCAAVVGEIRPKRLADGAAMPPPKAARRSRATGCAGTRSPTLSWPPVTRSDTRAARGRISVSGPGQNAAASRRAPSGTARAQSAAAPASARWTMTGWSAGRPLAAKMRRTASSLPASAPSPYTVSVGKATSSPARRPRRPPRRCRRRWRAGSARSRQRLRRGGRRRRDGVGRDSGFC